MQIRPYSHMALGLADLLDLLAVLVAGGLVILVQVGRPSLPRVLLTLAFVFFVPGRAIVSNWPRLGEWSEAAMPLVLSLAVLCLVATVTLWAHVWHPLGLFQAEAALSILGLLMGAVRRRTGGGQSHAGRAES
jgi:uncharacterized membrane protein